MFPLVSVLTQLLLLALVVTAAGLGVAVGYFYLLARRAERPTLSPQERAELRQRDGEIAAIRDRVEEIYRHQTTGQETQHQIVQQQLEQVHHQLKARARQIEGLQHQIRHEVEQRDRALAELRARLEEVVAARPLPSARALPEASPLERPPAPEPPPPTWSWEPIALAFGVDEESERVAPAPEPAFSERPSPLDGLVQWTALDLPDEELGHDGPAGDGSDPFAYAGGDGQAAPTPADAEDLTVLSGVDAGRQADLYRLGVRSVDDVARWTRADARRVAAALDGLSEDDLMNGWVFEAQSILFAQYQRQLEGRPHAA